MVKSNKKIFKYLLVLWCFVLISLVVLNFPQELLADVGNNNRYDGGSGGDSGDGDLFILFYLIELLFRIIFIFGPVPGVIILIILGIVFFFIFRKHGSKIKENLSKLQTVPNTINSSINTTNNTNFMDEESVINKIQEVDPNFSRDKFIGWAKEVFIKIQQAWSERNWKIIRPFESEELFSQHSSQLEEYIKNGKINKIEKININYSSLRDFRIDGDKEVLTVELHAIMRDYVVDDKTNKVLESDPNRDYHMQYIMTFNRKVGVKTEAGRSNKTTTNCPNCGAPTEITSAGQCEYCGSVITTGEHDWVLSDIRKK